MLEDINSTANLGGGRVQLTTNTNVSTGGTLQVTGGIGLTAPFDADLSIAVVRMGLKDPQLYKTRADGTVTINGPLAGGARIAGQIVLNETEVQIPSTGFSGAGAIR